MKKLSVILIAALAAGTFEYAMANDNGHATSRKSQDRVLTTGRTTMLTDTIPGKKNKKGQKNNPNDPTSPTNPNDPTNPTSPTSPTNPSNPAPATPNPIPT